MLTQCLFASKVAQTPALLLTHTVFMQIHHY